MTQREITFICTDSDISPRTLQYGGMQGEDNATELKFDISDLDLTVESGHSVAYRMDCTDGTGGFYSENLTLQTGSSNKKYVLFSVPYIVTRPGGVAKLHLVISDLDSDNVEAAILYSKTAKLYFDATGEGSTARNQYKRELSGLMEEAATSAAESAASAAESAASAAESATSAASAQESAEHVKLELEKLNAVNRITLNEPLSVDSTGKQLTVKITYYGGDDPSPITATQVLSSAYHDANCIRYINLSHDLDAGEVVNVTADRDPEGWTSIANITIANGMWQLSSVIWLDDILYHDQSETAHADIRKELEAVGDDIGAQIETHNDSISAHPYIKQNTGEQIRGHNLSPSAHADIRDELMTKENITNRIVMANATGEDVTDNQYYTAAASEKRIGAQIETHNDSLSAHPYIKQNTGEQISGHNLSPSAHADIRDELEALKQQGIVVDAGSIAYSLNLKLVNGKPVIEYDEIQGGV